MAARVSKEGVQELKIKAVGRKPPAPLIQKDFKVFAEQSVAMAYVGRGLVLRLLYLQKAVRKTNLLDRASHETDKLAGVLLFSCIFHSRLKQR